MGNALERLGITTEGQQPYKLAKNLTSRGAAATSEGARDVISGKVSGKILASRVVAAESLQEGDAALKDNAYQRITETGSHLERRFGKRNPNRFISSGFVDAISDIVKLDPDYISRALRAMRIDLLLSDTTTMSEDVLCDFANTAEQFIKAYTTGEKIPDLATRLQNQWDGKTIQSFYTAYYKEPTPPNVLGIWVPYEINALNTFYNHRIEQGSDFSPFDNFILNSQRQGIPAQETIPHLRSASGIPYDRHVEQVHLNALCAGTIGGRKVVS